MARDEECRAANLLGALAVAIYDGLRAAVAGVLEGGESDGAALLSIGTRPGLPVSELSDILERRHSTTVRVVDRLEGKGLVRRVSSPVDARRIELHLTEEGRRRCEELKEARLSFLMARFASFKDEDRRALASLLDQLLSSIARDHGAARHICRFCDHSVCRAEQCPVGRPFQGSEKAQRIQKR